MYFSPVNQIKLKPGTLHMSDIFNHEGGCHNGGNDSGDND